MTHDPSPSDRPRSGRRDGGLGVVAASASAVLFGTSYVATAFALRSFTPLSVGLWRGLVGAIAVAAWLLLGEWRGRRPAPGGVSGGAETPPAPLSGRLWRLGILGVLGGSCFILGMNVAVQLSGAAIASFVAGLYAVLGAVIAAPLLRERLGPAPIAGFVTALAGTALLAGVQQGGASLGGIAAGLVAAASFALYLVLSRRWSGAWRLPSGVVLLSTLVCAAVMLLAIEAVTEPRAIFPSVRPDALLAMAWLVAAVSLAAGLLVQAAVRLIDARSSSAFLLLNPPTATVAAWLLLGERLTAAEFVGAALVLAGIALAAIPGTDAAALIAGRARPRQDEAPASRPASGPPSRPERHRAK